MDISNLKRNVKKLLNYYHKRVIILMYHRVVDIPSSPYHGIVSIQSFEQQMEYIQDFCNPIPLGELADVIQNNALPQKGVVVTFDDGYKDNLKFASPILKRFKIPATFFITTNYIGSKQEYWWDELERIVLLPGQSSTNSRIDILGEELSLDLSNASREQKLIYLKALHGFLKPLHPNQRDKVLKLMVESRGLDKMGRKEYLPMSQAELIQLATDDLFEIGAHTQGHPMLAALSPADQRCEIENSKQRLEDIIGKSVDTFAYPYGQSIDFDTQTARITHSLGFKAAVTSMPGIVQDTSNPILLPRIWIGDWDLKKFVSTIELHLI
jgi:peptidoglycan/xylan/chitin deacetylase (PgdA/CDA1 family)